MLSFTKLLRTGDLLHQLCNQLFLEEIALLHMPNRTLHLFDLFSKALITLS